MDPLVTVDSPETMNLMGLLFAGFVEKRLEDPQRRAQAQRLRGVFGITAGSMAIHLEFTGERITLRKGVPDEARASIRGEMSDLLAVVSGGSLWSAAGLVLRGRLSIGGNPLALLRLMPILLD